MKTKSPKAEKITVVGSSGRTNFKKGYIYEVLEVSANDSNLFKKKAVAMKYLKTRGYKYFQGKDLPVVTFVRETEGSFFFPKKKEIAYLKTIEVYA